MLTILEAATVAGVTKDKCRYWLKLLDLDLVKKEGKLYLSESAADLLKVMKNSVDSGLSPVAAAVEVKQLHAMPVKSDAPICNQDNDNLVVDKIADLEKAVLLMAAQLEKQNKVIALQASQLEKLSRNLLPATITKPVKAWQPAATKAPQVSWLKRAWLELINPTALRATP